MTTESNLTSQGVGGPGGKSQGSRPARQGSLLSRWVGLIAGPLLAVAIYLLIPAETVNDVGETVSGLGQPGRAVAAVGILMAVFWVTEALPIAATALIPIALFPLLTGGDVTIRAATAPYANNLIFLFMGGFILALTMQQWQLHRRIALRTILIVGTRPASLVAGFMIASAFLSMWVSNTATVVMMLPIALSVIELVRRELRARGDAHLPGEGEPFHFAICLMLGTAYAASIGGIGTLIGTPPNLLLAAFLKKEYDMEISFVTWMGVGLPLVIVFLPITWLMLTKIVYPIRLPAIPGERDFIKEQLERQGPMSRGEWLVLTVFIFTALAWIARPVLVSLVFPGGWRPLASLSDAGIAIVAAVLAFAIPVDFKRGVFLLTWQQAAKLPWGILILFGGGLSLASAVKVTGVAEYIGRGVSGLHDPNVVLLILLITTVVVFLTELTSNTATTATFLPILGAVAVGLGVSPALLVVPMAIAASCAFMMPVATPPNAIVFGSGELTIPQMCKAGFWLNLIGIGLVMLLMYGVAIHVLGIDLP
ncbi:MAG: DASS family sodium-coupled anion symporter [Phycisphaerales bacterium]|nr:MAG: DASS family sodium-coupled anion symporter [Phycisphaerales bacterium]